MFETVITFIILSYIFVKLLIFWFKHVWNGCECKNKEQEDEWWFIKK